MANEEHVEILKQGVEVWNEWRQDNPEIIPDLNFANLSDSNLTGIDLRFTKLKGADLSFANLADADLTKAHLVSTSLIRANLVGTNLTEVNLSKVDLEGSNLRKSNLTRANLNGADLNNKDLSEANLSGLKLTKKNFFRTNLSKANLSFTDLRFASLIGANLIEANLMGADCRGADFGELSQVITGNLDPPIRADLTRANCCGTNFTHVNFGEAVSFCGANLTKANFSRLNLEQADFSYADLRDADLSFANLRLSNFSQSNLANTNLSGAVLSESKLYSSNLRKANLSGAKLILAAVLGANFKKAILTGVCIEDWHINNKTNLQGVVCDYVYLKEYEQERRPHHRNFAHGEFTKLFQFSLETVDLIFREGLNWRAFVYTFHNTKIKNEEIPLAIQSIENKGDGVVVIKLEVPPGINKENIASEFWEGYNFAEKILKAQCQTRFEDKDKHINQLVNLLYQAQDKLGEIPKLMLEKPGIQQNFHGHIGSVAGNVEGDQKTIQHNYASDQRQTLAEAAAEIQQLLKQLEQTNPTATEAQQIEHVNDETTPKFKKRVVGALQATGEAAIDEFVLENKYLKVAKAAIKGWMKPE